MKKDEKLALWKERLQAFHASGQTCRECRMSRENLIELMQVMQKQQQKTETKLQRMEKVPGLIKGSIATPSLVAGIMNAKYVNGMPLARQEREFARYGLKLVYDRMKEEFLKSRYIHCDETRLQVIDEPGQQGCTQNWMWVYLTDRYSEAPQMVLFDYERTRSGYHPKNFLGNKFEGYLTCDGYQAYHGLKDSVTVTGCFTHARRRFDAALTALKKDFTKEQHQSTVTYQAMSRIGILYKIE